MTMSSLKGEIGYGDRYMQRECDVKTQVEGHLEGKGHQKLGERDRGDFLSQPSEGTNLPIP